MTFVARAFLVHEKNYTQYGKYSYYQANADDDLYHFPTPVPFAKRDIRQESEAQ